MTTYKSKDGLEIAEFMKNRKPLKKEHKFDTLFAYFFMGVIIFALVSLGLATLVECLNILGVI